MIVKKIKNFLKQYGWQSIPRICKSVLRRLGITIETFYLLDYQIEATALKQKMDSYNYDDVKLLTLKHFNTSTIISETKKQLFKQRFSSEDYSCYGIIKDTEIVYYTWISWKYMNYPSSFNKQEELLEGEALLEDSFCHPEYRGQGFHSKMNRFRLQKIGDRGRTKVLALVLKENTPALKVQLKNGFKILEKVTFYKVFNKIRIKHYKL